MSRKPLNLVEKWFALKAATTLDEQRLNATMLVVLFRLLDHQNPKTGRCNPSASRLARDIGVCIRTIYYSIDTLEEKGFIRRVKTAGSSNNYVVLRPSETKPAMQSSAEGAAMAFRKPLHSSAFKKEKKKTKKNRGVTAQRDQNGQNQPSGDDMQSAEKWVVSALERLGHGYESMIEAPTDVLLALLEQVARGEMTATSAATKLAAELRPKSGL